MQTLDISVLEIVFASATPQHQISVPPPYSTCLCFLPHVCLSLENDDSLLPYKGAILSFCFLYKQKPSKLWWFRTSRGFVSVSIRQTKKLSLLGVKWMAQSQQPVKLIWDLGKLPGRFDQLIYTDMYWLMCSLHKTYLTEAINRVKIVDDESGGVWEIHHYFSSCGFHVRCSIGSTDLSVQLMISASQPGVDTKIEGLTSRGNIWQCLGGILVAMPGRYSVTSNLLGRLLKIPQCVEQPFLYFIQPKTSVNQETLVDSEGKRKEEKRDP